MRIVKTLILFILFYSDEMHSFLVSYSTIDSIYTKKITSHYMTKSSNLQSLKSREPSFQTNITVQPLKLIDIFPVLYLTSKEFFPDCSTIGDKLEFVKDMIGLFLPKLLNPDVWRHDIIGIYGKLGNLIAFVDVSLQP